MGLRTTCRRSTAWCKANPRKGKWDGTGAAGKGLIGLVIGLLIWRPQLLLAMKQILGSNPLKLVHARIGRGEGQQRLLVGAGLAVGCWLCVWMLLDAGG